MLNGAAFLHFTDVDLTEAAPSTRHEHIYAQIQGKLMRSDELPNNVKGMGRALGDSCIVLSTLSMLSNPALEANGTFDLVPVERLVIDEASQIKIFEFLVSLVR